MPLSHHTITIGVAPNEKKYFCLQNDSYDAIATDVGVAQSDAGDLDEPTIDIKDLLQKGIVVRLAITISTVGMKQTRRILCTREKINTAIAALIGKQYGWGTIVSARVPVKRTLI